MKLTDTLENKQINLGTRILKKYVPLKINKSKFISSINWVTAATLDGK